MSTSMAKSFVCKAASPTATNTAKRSQSQHGEPLLSEFTVTRPGGASQQLACTVSTHFTISQFANGRFPR
jgi:hypothetical protein